MTITTALLLNALLGLAMIGGLAATIRAGLRIRSSESGETLHPSQPLPRALFAYEGRSERDEPLARAA